MFLHFALVCLAIVSINHYEFILIDGQMLRIVFAFPLFALIK